MSDPGNDPTRPTQAAGWYRDPTGQGEARYWDGSAWTDSVSRSGVTISVPMAFEHRSIPPMVGTEYVAPAPTAPPPQVMVVPSQQRPAAQPASRSPFGALLGGLLLAAAVVALIVVLVRAAGGDDDPTEPTAPPATEQPTAPPATDAPAPDEPGPETQSDQGDPQPADATTPPEGSG